jgi:phosphatidyl-myo-inositol dimannoside synthase
VKVIVATEARLFSGRDGQLRAPTQGRAYAFWTRYLEEFSEVRVLARVASAPAEGGHLVEGPGVKVLPVTDFTGLKGLLRLGWRARSDVREWAEVTPASAMIARLPGAVGGMLMAHARRSSRPYAIEVVGDPHAAVLGASLAGQASRAMALMARSHLRRQVRGAAAVSYVTKEMLQTSYPASARATVASYSSVELPEEAFRAPEDLPAPSDPFHLVMVGTMSQTYKGHDVLLEAMAVLGRQGVSTRASFVGGGRLRGDLDQAARAMSLDVTFTGQLGSADEVRAVLDTADLFVMPSRTEGLPRALIEAMARSLPAVGSVVGGIPELLDPQSMVPPGDAQALAGVIRLHLENADLRRRLAARNYAVAREYEKANLAIARKNFYSAVRAQAERHCQSTEER